MTGRVSHGIGAFAVLALCAACGGDAAPRYGAITIDADAPTATLSGVTHPTGPALDLAPGCAGYVDAEVPDHVVEVRELGKYIVRARSDDGPVGLVVLRGDEVLCDSDDNTGHEPAVQLTRPGRYAIRVASLTASEELAYQLRVGPDDKPDDGEGQSIAPDAVSVTVTSEPQGASVRTESGQVLGTTPAMFVLPATGTDAGSAEMPLVVELDGYLPQTLRGVPADGELVLHAKLEPDGPVVFTLTADDPQPIRDFTSVHQSVTVEQQCEVSHVAVEVAVRHSYIGDLLVQLRAPSGRVATLHRYRGANRNNLERTFDSDDVRMLRPMLGEDGQGEWRLTVRDSAELDSGSLDRFTLRLECGGEVPEPSGAADRRQRRRHPPRNLGIPRRPPRQIVLDPWN